MCTLVDAGRAPSARASARAELRGLLAEIAREHGINRALMRQELAFLAHLTRLLGQRARAAATPPERRPAPAAPPAHRVLDLQA